MLLHPHQYLTLIHTCFELHFFPSNLHLHLYAISFVKNFYSFFNVIMLKTCIFKSSVLFETNTLLDKSLRVLQFPTHLSNPTANL